MMHRSRHAQIVAFVALVVLVLPVLFGAIPGLASPQGAPQAMPPHPQKLREWQQQGRRLPSFMTDPAFFQSKGINQSAAHPSQLTGTINALAVVIDFSDNVSTVTASFFDSLIFAPPVSGLGSVRDYYAEVSYGQVDIVTVNLPSSLGWVRAPNNYSYYTNNQYCMGTYPNNCQKLAEDVVDAVNSVVDFSQYDNDGDGNMEPIMLIHAGPGAEFTGSTGDIWSHSWTLAYPRTYDGVTIPVGSDSCSLGIGAGGQVQYAMEVAELTGDYLDADGNPVADPEIRTPDNIAAGNTAALAAWQVSYSSPWAHQPVVL